MCLLPARNAEEDLPDYLESVARFADAVVALDDGSTDRTRELLEAHPLVRVVLSNPPRETWAAWDDSANRNRLLEAAADLDPDWILSLDADERLPPDDAAALRRFVEGDALPGCAYGLRHLRMWGDRFDPTPRYVYRLFAYEPGQAFPERRLHFDPVPTTIPRGRWLRTTIRLRHLAASSEGRRLARLAKYREADPEGEYPTGFGGLDERPGTDLARWGPRPADLPVLVGASDAGIDLLPSPDARQPGGARLVCLLPVRNGEEDLPGYLESVARFADAVVALDDGSTDRTREIVEAHPLVKIVLANPRRETYAGWDDAANRTRLLEAAAALDPDWIVSIDVDERLDPDDAAALRRFVEEKARPDRAYQFRVHRMVGDLSHYDRADLWVCRLFAHRPGQRLPDRALHFVPIPESIPPDRWVRTTLRIQHLAGLTEERRRERYAKYLEADPGLAFQPGYLHILGEPGLLRRWEPRPPGLPVMPGHAPSEAFDLDLQGPVLSAIVIARDDERTIARTVRSVLEQDCPEPFEVIVVASGTDRTAAIVRQRFPEVTVVELLRPALPGEARNAGLRLARGDYVSFPGSHVELPSGSLAARLRAHERGYPMVSGSILNATHLPAGWASYFLDHSGSLPGRPSGELSGPPAHCSYARDFLLQIGGFPEDMRAGEDTVVNLELARRGYRAYRARDARLYHRSPCTTTWRLVRHHFERGRALGRIVLDQRRERRPAMDAGAARRLLVSYVPRRLRQTSANVARWGEGLRPIYRRVRPLVALGATAAWAGAWYEPVRRGSLGSLVPPAGATLLVAGLDQKRGTPVGRADVILLARADPLSGALRVVALPRDLLVDIPGRGSGRLNEAYYWGARSGGWEGRARGMELLRRTTERALGVRIHAHVAVDFEGFRRVVDAVGGIELEVDHPIHEEFVGEDGRVFAAHFEPGRQRVGGRRALEYARTRHVDGDAARRGRHLEIAVALLRSLRRVRSPERLARALRAVGSSVHAGPWPVAWLLLAVAALRARPSRVSTLVLGEPTVRSVEVNGRWFHRGELSVVGAAVRRGLGLDAAGGSNGQSRARTEAGRVHPEATPSALRSRARNR